MYNEIWLASNLERGFELELGNILKSYIPFEVSAGMNRKNFDLKSSEPYGIGGDIGVFAVHPIHIIFVLFGTYVLGEFVKSFASEMGKNLANKITDRVKKKSSIAQEAIENHKKTIDHSQTYGVIVNLHITFKLEEDDHNIAFETKIHDANDMSEEQIRSRIFSDINNLAKFAIRKNNDNES